MLPKPIIFIPHRKPSPLINIKLLIDGNEIPQVTTTKFLGVYIDQHLTWSEHIKIISTKIAKNIGVINRLAHYVPKKVLLNLYYSLVYPYLSYCSIVWASNYIHRLHKLNLLLKRAIRVIARAPIRSHTSQLFAINKILKIDQINILQTSEFMYKYSNKLLPPVFDNYFTITSDTHSYSTRQVELYRGVFSRTNTRLFALRSMGPSTWNNIPISIRHLPNLKQFKKSLFTHLINNQLSVQSRPS